MRPLVFAGAPDASTGGVDDDDTDLYGSRCWTTHQVERRFPPIEERERTDLTERCLHWLRALLRYRRPPARVLEIGAAHGGFVRLARLAGFDAVGIEMSPAVVERARRTFDVDMRVGPLESAGFADAAFDVVASFDVLEHLAQPETTLREIRRVLTRGACC
jgi:SAM-dependent methyltransferase